MCLHLKHSTEKERFGQLATTGMILMDSPKDPICKKAAARAGCQDLTSRTDFGMAKVFSR